MNFILYITIVGLIAGVIGTFSGSLFVLLLRGIKEAFLTFILGISAGIMTVIVFLDLLPESLKIGSTASALFGMLLGVILMAALDQLLPHHHILEKADGDYLKSGLLLAVGIALHNFPEGLAVGAGFSAENSLGIGLALLIGIHNFPEGMAMATTLSLARLPSIKIVVITLISGIPMGIGAFIGGYLGGISDFILSISLGFAAGAMLYITFDDLIPTAHQKNEGNLAIVGIILGVFLGTILTNQI